MRRPRAAATRGGLRRVVVAGTVAWSDAGAIRRELAALPPGSVILHGDSPGADALAGAVAASLGLAVEPMRKSRGDDAKYPGAGWRGVNERVLAAGAELVLAFHPSVATSRGTEHLVELAAAWGVAVRVIEA